MAIEFDNNVILRQVLRQGTEQERRTASAAAFLAGEGIYTTDTQRLFVGTGNASESNTVTGNKYLGALSFGGNVSFDKGYAVFRGG